MSNVSQFLIAPEDFLILIVDDTEANIRLLSHVLRGEGFQPIVAFNGSDAIDLIESREPDLVLLDIMMPDMTGIEVCTEIKQKDKLKDIPIIFLSALSETSDKVEGFRAGGVDYITKPFQKDEVLARIRTHLFLSKLQKERKQRIIDLRKREADLRDLNKKKDDLVRMVSHDIKNPLTGIVGLANMLKQDMDFSEEEKAEMLQVMESSGRKLLEMVEKVLDAEDSSKKMDEPDLLVTDLRELADKVKSVNNPKAILKKIGLSIDLSLKHNRVLLDEVKMEIALNNLVSNALKFTQTNGTVSLSITNSDDLIQFRITDTGIGIPEHMIDKLFTEHDSDSNYSSKGTDGEIGTGLGLDVVQNIVRIHKGKVWVESIENEGSTFYIEMPLIKAT
ncbi:MAG TPA: hypothetical protein DEQ34_11285 [Balneolaceae bacterium]|nr:hypothetical protein [Balneolaceae bacterium]